MPEREKKNFQEKKKKFILKATTELGADGDSVLVF